MARPRDILLRLTGDPAPAQKALGELTKDVKTFAQIKAEARAEILTAGATARLENLQRQLDNYGKQEQTADVKIRSAKTIEQIERIEKKLAGIKDQTVNVKVHETGAGGTVGGGAGAGGIAGGIAGKLGPVGVGAVAAGGAAVLGIKSVSDAAKESEVSLAKLRAQLKASNISYAEHGKAIDSVIQKTSKLSGLDDEDLQDAFTGLVRGSGSVKKALEGVGIAADLARAKNIDVATAGNAVAKVYAGSLGPLKRLGIEVEKSTAHQDKLKLSIAELTKERTKAKGPEKEALTQRIEALKSLKDEAKAEDNKVTATNAIAALQQRVAGQAKAYGQTAAGAQDKFKVASENLREAIGEGLTPVLADMANGAVKVVDSIQTNFPKVKRIIGNVIDAIRGFFRKNREDIDGLIQAFKNIGAAVKAVFVDVVVPAIKSALPGIKDALGGIVEVARGVVRIFTAIFTGDFGKALDGVKDIFNGAITALKGILRTALGPFRKLGSAIGHAIAGGVKGALNGLKKIGQAAVNGVIALFNDAINAINKITPGAIKVKGHTIVPGIPNIPNIPSVGGSKDSTPAGTFQRDQAPHAGTRVYITTPGGGPPDPKVLARQLSRQLARHPG